MDEVKDGITIEATLVRETSNAWLLDCEGDTEWFPKAYCIFDAQKEELTAPRWILQSKFPDEDY